MNYRESTEMQLDFLRRKEKQLSELLILAPGGKLERKNAHGNIYYYVNQNGKRSSLFGKQQLVKRYLHKERCEKQLASVKNDIPILERVLRQYQPILPSDNWWDDREQEQNCYKTEDKRNLYKGVYYRSKSEMVIASLLSSYDIEFKYEASMEVNGRQVYPDFIIKRPRDGNVFIWEHFGMVTDDRYLKKAFRKLEEYHHCGIDLWDQLLISFDQKDGGISADGIDKMIRTFLL